MSEKCGCEIRPKESLNAEEYHTSRAYEIVYCPLHRAAPIGNDLAKMVIRWSEICFSPNVVPSHDVWREIVAKAREFKTKTEER